jgi:hypothetical protein
MVMAACFQKTGGFALYWPLARANFAAVFLLFLFGAAKQVSIEIVVK